MNNYTYPHYATDHGYMTENIKQQYILKAMGKQLLPENAHRMSHIVSLDAPNDPAQPIQFWQLHSVLGTERIVKFVRKFYERVYADEIWFSSVFSRIAGIDHHVNSQAAMWVDAMGGGAVYHGGEYRLSFHHTHNAMQLMNDKGATRWVELMVKTLNDPTVDLTDDIRVRPAINTFLDYFMGRYSDDFKFKKTYSFGNVNAPLKRRIHFMNMSSDAIAALDESVLKEALAARGVDVASLSDKQALVNQALRL